MKKLKSQMTSIIAKICLFSFFFAISQNAFASNRNLTIFAEQNMVPALIEITNIFSEENNVTISVNFNSSLESINEIDLGEPANIFISAHSGIIDTLKQKGLVDVYNIGYIAQDQLQLVTSKNNPNIDSRLLSKNITLQNALKILNSIKASVITDQAEVTSGLYSDQLIKSLSLTKIKLFKKLGEDKTSIFDIINNSPANYALLLKSQTINKDEIMVLASSKKDNIFYQALVIAGDDMKTSREFLKFLKNPKITNILQKNGFTVN